MLHCLKRGFPSYVDASRQEGTILNGDARDYDVSTQGALVANIKVIARFTAINYLAKHYDLPCRDISQNSAVSPHRHTIARQVKLYFDAKNLLNTPLEFTEGPSQSRPIQREFYDITLLAGVRVSL